MKKIIFYFLALLFAVWLGVVLHQNPGYVVISSKDISIETSLWFFVVAIIALFFVIYTLLRFGSGAGFVVSYIGHWFGAHKRKRARAQTVLGLYDLVEGNWPRAEKRLEYFAKHSDMPIVNYLAAALVAQRQNEFKRRDKYLRLAQRVARDRPLTVNLAQVILQIGNEEWQDAAVILKKLYRSHPKNSFILDLLVQAYLELTDWDSLRKILPKLHKRKVLAAKKIEQIEERVYGELLLANSHNWEEIPRYLKKSPFLLTIYAGYLLDNGKDDEAEALLKVVLRKNLDKRLLNLYSSLTSSKPIKHLMRAEKWLKDNPNNVDLLLCLGKICRRQKLWGKARHYLEKSIKIEPTLSAHAELGRLMVEQKDLPGAINFYEKAIG